MFPLTKSLNPKVDYPELGPELACLHAQLSTESLAKQHEHRQWEYALASRAVRLWYLDYAEADPANALPEMLTWWDVGGGGSPFGRMELIVGMRRAVVIDPVRPDDPYQDTTHLPVTLENLAEEHLMVAGRPHVLTCLSVLEHITFPTPFLRRAVELLRPGGLFFATLDGWAAEGKDMAHFCEHRKRLYNPQTWRELVGQLHRLGLARFGGVDWTYRGDQLYGSYTFFSVSMRKPMTPPAREEATDAAADQP